jgi:hypothetical protein
MKKICGNCQHFAREFGDQGCCVLVGDSTSDTSAKMKACDDFKPKKENKR